MERLTGSLMKVYSLLLFFFVLISCANPQYPSGGPVDSTPPEITGTSILPGTLHFKGDEITFSFDEYMNKPSVAGAVFISPSVGNQIKTEWSGKEFTIRFLKELKPDMTYVITIGTGAQDHRAGNPMKSSFQLAFSTGDQLDSAKISGKAFYASDFRPAKGALVMAYFLSDTTRPDPSRQDPDYRTQVGQDGRFSLTYLREGHYRIFVIDDQVKNDLWDKNQEPIGIGELGSVLAGYEETEPPVWFLDKPDSAAPVVQGAVQESQHLLKITFDEPVVLGESSAEFTLLKNDIHIPVSRLIPSFQADNQVFLPTDSLGTGDFTLISSGFSDTRLNKSHQDTFRFSISEAVSRKKQLRLQSPSDSSAIVSGTDSLMMIFASPVRTDSVRFYIKPVKSQVAKGRRISVSGSQNPGYVQTLHPAGKWPEKSVVRGLAFSGQDTVSFQFFTFDPDETGTLSGTLETLKDQFPVYLSLYKAAGNLKVTEVETRGTLFKISNLASGRYLINGFQDQNGNRKWDGGTALPWSPAEPRYSAPDTLRVRARWSLEDILIKKW